MISLCQLSAVSTIHCLTNEKNEKYQISSEFNPTMIFRIFQGIKMLVAVVVLYAILWLPMNVFQLCLNLLCYQGKQYQNFCSHGTLLQLLYITSHFLTVSNTAINPMIYGFANNRFRVKKKLIIFI
jgi:hypothetical protein